MTNSCKWWQVCITSHASSYRHKISKNQRLPDGSAQQPSARARVGLHVRQHCIWEPRKLCTNRLQDDIRHIGGTLIHMRNMGRNCHKCAEIAIIPHFGTFIVSKYVIMAQKFLRRFTSFTLYFISSDIYVTINAAWQLWSPICGSYGAWGLKTARNCGNSTI